ncbi:MAG: TetR/AcrR family transcriptional regulator [Aeromicrobium sp.]|uniref:TetR/AcrR family transcriptional regulator n=1 Tax=Aeromicrobium sp. TaxID=1871063 RepID=UPI0026263F6C|nr:TetR/AcrR family transcriptional regulator [Aeromicrobium sp.]MDF1706188.1 TetR/AcrR family transcriptional regulator [Aeromicrobium sp.]
MAAVPASSTRFDRRRAQTRSALIKAAQDLLAEGRTGVPIQEVTERADVGIGTFYNHFDSKDQLFDAAVVDALEQLADLLDSLDSSLTDPAAHFARSFRLTGRLHRLAPQLSRVLLARGHELSTAPQGIGPRARRDILAAQAAGQFEARDLDRAMVLVTGSMIELGRVLHDRPELDGDAMTDEVTSDVLVALGMTRADADRICSTELPRLDDLTTDLLDDPARTATP